MQAKVVQTWSCPDRNDARDVILIVPDDAEDARFLGVLAGRLGAMGGATSHIGALAKWMNWPIDGPGDDNRPALTIDIERVKTASPRYGTAQTA